MAQEQQAKERLAAELAESQAARQVEVDRARQEFDQERQQLLSQLTALQTDRDESQAAREEEMERVRREFDHERQQLLSQLAALRAEREESQPAREAEVNRVRQEFDHERQQLMSQLAALRAERDAAIAAAPHPAAPTEDAAAQEEQTIAKPASAGRRSAAAPVTPGPEASDEEQVPKEGGAVCDDTVQVHTLSPAIAPRDLKAFASTADCSPAPAANMTAEIVREVLVTAGAAGMCSAALMKQLGVSSGSKVQEDVARCLQELVEEMEVARRGGYSARSAHLDMQDAEVLYFVI